MARTLGYWIPTVLFSLAMTASGLSSLLGVEQMLANFARLGFPALFPAWLGAAKLLGAATLLAPGLARLKEWATAGFAIVLTSASMAHIAAGDPVGDAIATLVMLGLCLAGWALRPATRKLAA